MLTKLGCRKGVVLLYLKLIIVIKVGRNGNCVLFCPLCPHFIPPDFQLDVTSGMPQVWKNMNSWKVIRETASFRGLRWELSCDPPPSLVGLGQAPARQVSYCGDFMSTLDVSYYVGFAAKCGPHWGGGLLRPSWCSRSSGRTGGARHLVAPDPPRARPRRSSRPR